MGVEAYQATDFSEKREKKMKTIYEQNEAAAQEFPQVQQYCMEVLGHKEWSPFGKTLESVSQVQLIGRVIAHSLMYAVPRDEVNLEDLLPERQVDAAA